MLKKSKIILIIIIIPIVIERVPIIFLAVFFSNFFVNNAPRGVAIIPDIIIINPKLIINGSDS